MHKKIEEAFISWLELRWSSLSFNDFKRLQFYQGWLDVNGYAKICKAQSLKHWFTTCYSITKKEA